MCSNPGGSASEQCNGRPSIHHLFNRRHQCLFVFAIIAATRTTYEQLRIVRSGRKGCDRNRCGSYQDSMPNQASSKKRIASDRDGKTNRPNESQHLQNIMPNADVGNVAKRANFVVEYEVPRICD